ncbi:hypothetical protein EGI26_20715 [Lacihabitans sp. CCS-44]|uniref:hypothetical protein n=1 Tax=Lacihabitans sp. CCS-44 TaxID=2487331 RepID=UPI0020CBC2A8|nr:hypothetical protein [Lacihabitans sp. CCS-44]MCP9757592.1 hypothetical protein [Lacihabitans sp. CCS-44]
MSTLALTYPKKRSTNSSISKFANKIFDNSEGIFRGFKFGQDIDDIIAKERFKVFEREKDYVGVSFTNSKMETIDILYYKNSFNKLEKIQVDVFLNTEHDSNELFDHIFHQIFEKQGFPIPIKLGYSWNRLNEPKISLSKVNNKIEYGVLLILEA